MTSAMLSRHWTPIIHLMGRRARIHVLPADLDGGSDAEFPDDLSSRAGAAWVEVRAARSGCAAVAGYRAGALRGWRAVAGGGSCSLGFAAAAAATTGRDPGGFGGA